MSDTTLNPQMLELLRCPCPAHASLSYLSPDGEDSPTGVEGSTTDDELICDECGRAFPIRDGIPVMLLDEARSPGD